MQSKRVEFELWVETQLDDSEILRRPRTFLDGTAEVVQNAMKIPLTTFQAISNQHTKVIGSRHWEAHLFALNPAPLNVDPYCARRGVECPTTPAANTGSQRGKGRCGHNVVCFLTWTSLGSFVAQSLGCLRKEGCFHVCQSSPKSYTLARFPLRN